MGLGNSDEARARAAGASDQQLEISRELSIEPIQFGHRIHPIRPGVEAGPVLIDLDADEPVTILPTAQVPPKRSDWFRRTVELTLTVPSLAALAPVMLLLILAIRLESRGSAIFKHQRLGRNGRPFTCYKLRTMVDGAADQLPHMLAQNPEMAKQFAEKFKLEDDPRVTRLGKWLRRLNLDELPQLWNVLKGDMSLVGPRPIVAEEAARYGDSLPIVLSVRPGLTGLWQVSGRSETSYDERVKLDVEYAQIRTLRLDAEIFVKTVLVAFDPSSNGAA